MNLLINNRAGGNAPLIAERVSEGILKENSQKEHAPFLHPFQRIGMSRS